MKARIGIGLTAAIGLGIVVLVLGAAVAGITWRLRVGLRDQILRREGESLHAVALMQEALERDRPGGGEAAGEEEPWVILALQISRLRGVLGVQVLGPQGQPWHSMPTTLQLPAMEEGAWSALRARQPVARFRPAALLGALYGLEDDPMERAPLLEIAVPLYRSDGDGIAGVARYVIEGGPIAREFALLDRRLARQAGFVWLLSAGVLVAGTAWALVRLVRTNAVLRQRTEDLVQANRELSLMAKTSALGAVTAHLFHGLRNPIAGLEAFLGNPRPEEAEGAAGAWSEASATARRLRSMVNEVIGLLQEEKTGTEYELSGREVLALAVERVADLAARKRVTVSVLEAPDATRVTNRQAGLVAAILANLAQNACEAVPPGDGRMEGWSSGWKTTGRV
jgi:signal transduction histidine kinase